MNDHINVQTNHQSSKFLPVNQIEFNLNNNNINNIFNININLDIYKINDKNNITNFINERNKELSKWSPNSSDSNINNNYNSPKTLGKSISYFIRNIIFSYKIDY